MTKKIFFKPKIIAAYLWVIGLLGNIYWLLSLFLQQDYMEPRAGVIRWLNAHMWFTAACCFFLLYQLRPKEFDRELDIQKSRQRTNIRHGAFETVLVLAGLVLALLMQYSIVERFSNLAWSITQWSKWHVWGLCIYLAQLICAVITLRCLVKAQH